MRCQASFFAYIWLITLEFWLKVENFMSVRKEYFLNYPVQLSYMTCVMLNVEYDVTHLVKTYAERKSGSIFFFSFAIPVPLESFVILPQLNFAIMGFEFFRNIPEQDSLPWQRN